MTCQLCKSGNNREAPNHAYTFRHRKILIKLFKMYNEKKKDKNPDEYDKIFDECLNELIN